MSADRHSDLREEMAIPVTSKDNMSLPQNDQTEEGDSMKGNKRREMSSVSPLPDVSEENTGYPVSGEGDDGKQIVKVTTSISPCSDDQVTETSIMSGDQPLPESVIPREENTGSFSGMEEMASSVNDIDVRSKGKGKPIIIRQDFEDDAVEDIKKRICLLSDPQKAVEPRPGSSQQNENCTVGTEVIESSQFLSNARSSPDSRACGKQKRETFIKKERRESRPYPSLPYFHFALIVGEGYRLPVAIIPLELQTHIQIPENTNKNTTISESENDAQDVVSTKGYEYEPPDIQSSSDGAEMMKSVIHEELDPPQSEISALQQQLPALPLMEGFEFPYPMLHEPQTQQARRGPQVVPEEMEQESAGPAPGLPDLVGLGILTQEGEISETQQDLNRRLAAQCVGKNKSQYKQ